MTANRADALPAFLPGTPIPDKFFRAVVGALPIALYTTDAQGWLTYFNSAAATLTGRTPEIGSDRWCITWKIFGPDGTPLPHDQCPMAIALQGGEPPPGNECLAKRPDGTWFWFSSRPTILRDPQGGILGGINLLLDITGRKRTDRAEFLLSAIVDSSDDAIISKNLEGVITSWNKGAERLFGYTAAEAIGQTVASLLIPADRQEEEPNILARLRRGERVDHFDTVRRRKDGSLFEISLTVSPVKDSEGVIIGASKIARDITETKRIQLALAESEARFRQIADSMPQIVWTARPDGTVDYYNERWFQFTGHSPFPFEGSDWERVLHPDDLQPTRDAWSAAVGSGEPFNMEHRFLDPRDHRWVWFVGRAVPVRDRSGKITKWCGTSTNIDDQKLAQEDLRRANEDLEQFAYSASHDLQEPLRTINIYGELLSKRYGNKLDGEAGKFMRFMRNAAMRMETLVRDLLTYTQVTRLDQPAQLTDANQHLKASLENLSEAISRSGAQVTSGPLPSLPVHGTHLQQLFQNLVGNSIKYRSPERLPVIHIAAELQSQSWLFRIADNGIGIDAEYKETIFGLFKRLHTSDEYSGTGIGLAICRRIVDRYHGRIWVESEPGRGSSVFFSLPV